MGIHLFPFRTEKLRPTTPMVLPHGGRVGSRLLFKERSSPVVYITTGLLFFVDIPYQNSRNYTHTLSLSEAHNTIYYRDPGAIYFVFYSSPRPPNKYHKRQIVNDTHTSMIIIIPEE